MQNGRGHMPIPIALRPYSRTTVAGGPQLHYYDAGTAAGPPLVLIHGLGDEADTWRHVLPQLAARRRVIAPDLPGFGRSDKPHRAYTTAFFARTIAALLAQLGIARAEIVGSSMGAVVAQRLALARPALVERLALIGGGMPITHERIPPPLWLFLLPGLGELSYTSLRRSQDEAYATLRPYYRDLDGLPEDDRAFLRERVWARVWSAGQRRAFLSALRWLAIDQATRAAAFRQRLARLHTPTLLLWGEHDLIASRARAEALQALLPDARLQLIPGSGHLPQQERPEALVEALG